VWQRDRGDGRGVWEGDRINYALEAFKSKIVYLGCHGPLFYFIIMAQSSRNIDSMKNDFKLRRKGQFVPKQI
jgi:hypothetical protein